MTNEEIELIKLKCFEIGYDDDDPALTQFCHLCWPYQSYQGAICGSKRLWFLGNFNYDQLETEVNKITCEKCLIELKKIANVPQLLLIIGNLSRWTDATEKLEEVCENYLYEIDHPKSLINPAHSTTIEDIREALEIIYKFHSEQVNKFKK